MDHIVHIIEPLDRQEGICGAAWNPFPPMWNPSAQPVLCTQCRSIVFGIDVQKVETSEDIRNLERVLELLNRSISSIGSEWKEPYKVVDQTGRYILLDAILAKANVLVAISNLRRSL